MNMGNTYIFFIMLSFSSLPHLKNFHPSGRWTKLLIFICFHTSIFRRDLCLFTMISIYREDAPIFKTSLISLKMFLEHHQTKRLLKTLSTSNHHLLKHSKQRLALSLSFYWVLKPVIQGLHLEGLSGTRITYSQICPPSKQAGNC